MRRTGRGRLNLAAAFVLAGIEAAAAQQPPVPPEGANAANSVAKSESDLTSAERRAADQRRSGEDRFRQRDEQMRRSMKSICKGC